ncbi:MAG TPA: hypothetical protein VFA20_18840 [Myxococcaceae bacterium]|nr:hypothetical protein [Myxococcaceae bacterium]
MLVALRFLFLTSRLALSSQPESDPSTWTPPPIVQVPEDAVPRKPAAPSQATPSLPPGALPGASPFSPTPVPKPEGPEYGLMITESLFGVVTAAGVCLIPYFLLRLVPGAIGGTDDPTLQALILILTFSGVPLAVSQTEQSIAQGSRYYDVEGWPAPLGGLLTEAAVLGLYFWARGQPGADAGATEIFLISGTVAAVPLVEMGMINFFKVPRSQLPPPRSLFTADGQGVHLGLPAPQPFASMAGGRAGLGIQLPVLSGSF